VPNASGRAPACLEQLAVETETLAPQGQWCRSDPHYAQGGDRPYFSDGGRTVVALSAASSPPIIASDIGGEQLANIVPPAVRKERHEPVIGSTCGVFERRSRMLLLESGVRGVELGERGVHVFDVEEHLQRDSTFRVEAE